MVEESRARAVVGVGSMRFNVLELLGTSIYMCCSCRFTELP